MCNNYWIQDVTLEDKQDQFDKSQSWSDSRVEIEEGNTQAPKQTNIMGRDTSANLDDISKFRGGALGYTVFQRTYAKHTRGDELESFQDCTQRLMDSQLVTKLCQFEESDTAKLQALLLQQKASLSGRYLATLGSPGKGFLPLTSCAVTTIKDVASFLYTAHLSLLGVGVGYSVQAEYVNQLPMVQEVNVRRKDENGADFIVPNTRLGWIQLFERLLEAFFGTTASTATSTTTSLTYSLHQLEDELDADALEQVMENIVSVLTPRAGLQARAIDCMDVVNILAPAVCQGKTRRAALLAIGDATDIDFLQSKRWDLGNLPLWRSASNNSVACSDVSQLPDEFWEGYQGNGEAIGILNMNLIRTVGRTGESQYPDPTVCGVSACAEQGLADQEVSCLSELALPYFDSSEELWEATRLLYTVCKNTFRLDPPEEDADFTGNATHKARQNYRMGIGITGYMQASEEQKSWLSNNYKKLRAYDEWYSNQHELPPSIKLTTVKPSGTVSLLSGTTPGCHPGFARHYIRRIRFNGDDPLLQRCQEYGLKTEPELGFDGKPNPNRRQVVEFACELPTSTRLAEQTSAVEQLEVVRRLQKEWSDSAVSVTVYYRQEELDDIREWLAEHFTKEIKACSFLLHCDHGFQQAPYEQIDEATFVRESQRCQLLSTRHPNKQQAEDTMDDTEAVTVEESECSSSEDAF